MSNGSNQLIKNRHIRLFISSTFEDMQNERNYLMRRTFPELQLMASQRDVMLTAIDLRWGITQEEAENGKVVDACFREIENSIPFFIGILGNRYGWCPESNEIDDNTTLRYPLITKLLGLRMTEMEIQFAVLRRNRKMHACFFIKTDEHNQCKYDGIEENDKREKLIILKNALLKNSRYPVQYYKDEEELSKKIVEAFLSLLNKLFRDKSVSSITKEIIRQKSFKNQLCNSYVRNEQYFEFLNDWLYAKNRRQLVIIGESGVGKSALLANWIHELEGTKNKNQKIINNIKENEG